MNKFDLVRDKLTRDLYLVVAVTHYQVKLRNMATKQAHWVRRHNPHLEVVSRVGCDS